MPALGKTVVNRSSKPPVIEAGRTPRAKVIKVIDIACPHCHVEPGQACRGEAGTAIKTTHIARRRMATRQANEAEKGGAARFLELPHARRGEIRKAAGFTQEDLARFLGLDQRAVSDGECQQHPAIGRQTLTLWGLWLVRMADRR